MFNVDDEYTNTVIMLPAFVIISKNTKYENLFKIQLM